LASLPYTLAIEAEEAVVERAGVARMNAGHLHQLSHVKLEHSPAAPLPPGEGVTEISSGIIRQEPRDVP
jgi:hypothetical protein